jgi:HlyD family secretion protein
MKKKVRIGILAGVLIAGASAFWYFKIRNEAANTNELIVFGNVDVRQVDLAINGSERIAELLVEEGDRVSKGDLLAKLQTERLEYAVDRAKALLEMQQQIVARLEAGSRAEEISKAKADVAAAVAVANDAKRLLERRANLTESGIDTQQELDDALAKYESAAAQVAALQALLDLLVAGPRVEDKNEAKALLRRYEAELAQALHDLEDAELLAPNDGVIQERILEVGDMASPLKTVYTLALNDPVWVRAYVSEPDLGKIHEGMKASVSTDSFPDKSYDGWIGFISPVAEFTPRPVQTQELRTKLVYQIRVFVNNPANELRLGMPATVKLRLGQGDSTTSPEAVEKP